MTQVTDVLPIPKGKETDGSTVRGAASVLKEINAPAKEKDGDTVDFSRSSVVTAGAFVPVLGELRVSVGSYCEEGAVRGGG